MEKELWKDIKDYEGRYQVSNLGRVKSFLQNRNGKILKEKVSKPYAYRFVNLYGEDGTNNLRRVSRLVALAFIPNPHNYDSVDHIVKEEKWNNSVANLQWLPAKQNVQKDQGQTIIASHPAHLPLIFHSQRDAAEKTGVSRTVVQRSIRTGLPGRNGWTFKLKK